MSLPTPPHSRRSKDSSSASTTLSSSGVSADTWNDFRYGSPGPLMFLPLLSVRPERFVVQPSSSSISIHWDQLRKVCVNVLHKNSISSDTCELVHRRPIPQPSSQEDLTVLVVTPKTDQWITALDDMRGQLNQLGFTSLQIEFIDPSLMHLQTTSPPRHPEFTRAWNTGLETKVSQVLSRHKYLTLEVCRMGFKAKSEENNLTVSITIPVKPVETEWYQSLADVHDLLKEASFPDVHLDIAHGRLTNTIDQFTESDLDIQPLEMADYALQMGMGRSLSLQDGQSGTFGGIVNLSQGGLGRGTFGVTCWHVVADGKKKQPEEVQGATIISPSIDTHKKTLRFHDATAAQLTKQNESQKTIEERALNPKSEKEQMFNANNILGSVKAGSGDGHDVLIPGTRHRADWALIEMVQSRQPSTNTLPPMHNFPPKAQAAYPANPTLAGVAQVKDIDSDNKYVVFKVGQKTGHTMAELADIEATVMFEGEQEMFKQRNMDARARGEAEVEFNGTKEVVVYLDNKSGRSPGFADRGDSGAWSFTSQGKLFGMVIAACWRLDRNAVYLTPAELLFKHIGQVTGCEVSLP